jgi:hypothetical protein
MPAIPATHYVKSDDIHVAYQVLGAKGLFDHFVGGREP